MSNKILVSGSLSHIMKLCENKKKSMPRCKVVLPSKVIDDPSAVLRCTTAGSILVLKWSSIMLYTPIQANERAAPESIRALNLFSACTVTVGQYDTSPVL